MNTTYHKGLAEISLMTVIIELVRPIDLITKLRKTYNLAANNQIIQTRVILIVKNKYIMLPTFAARVTKNECNFIIYLLELGNTFKYATICQTKNKTLKTIVYVKPAVFLAGIVWPTLIEIKSHRRCLL